MAENLQHFSDPDENPRQIMMDDDGPTPTDALLDKARAAWRGAHGDPDLQSRLAKLASAVKDGEAGAFQSLQMAMDTSDAAGVAVITVGQNQAGAMVPAKGKWGSDKAGSGVNIQGAVGFLDGDITARTRDVGDQATQLGGKIGGESVKATDKETACERMARMMGIDQVKYHTDQAYRPIHTPGPDGKPVLQRCDPVPNQNHVIVTGMPNGAPSRVVSRKTVSDGYGVTQPADLFGVVDSFLASAKETTGKDPGIEQMHLWNNGALLYVQTGVLNLDLLKVIDSRGKEREIIGRLHGTSGWDGTSRQTAVTGEELLCRNVHRGIFGQRNLLWRWRAVGAVAERMAKSAGIIRKLVKGWSEAGQILQGLVGVTMTDKNLAEIMARTFVPNPRQDDGSLSVEITPQARNKGRMLLDTLASDSLGFDSGTLFGGVQTATHHATHTHGRLQSDKYSSPGEAQYLSAAGTFEEDFLSAAAATIDTGNLLLAPKWNRAKARTMSDAAPLYQAVTLADFA